MHDIALATSDADIAATYSVMQQLRPALEADEYLSRVRALERITGYRLVCLRKDGQVAAVAGFRLTASLAWGYFVYVDDLVCDDRRRSSGFGSALIDWIADYAGRHGCKELHLDSGVQRFDAHRFYLRERMDITCHHFRLGLLP